MAAEDLLLNAVLKSDMKLEALAGGLVAMADVQEAQSLMLQQILELLSATPGPSPMESLIRELTATLGQLVSQGRRTEFAIEKLTLQFGRAIIRGASDAPP